MFYSNGKINNANSIFHSLPPFFSLYQHQQDLTTNGPDLLPASLSAPPALEPTHSCYNQTVINWNDKVKNSEPFTTNSQLPARKLIKKRAAGAHSTKDRLRKIVTAQGPRDRRVRLSIQIARKFFDLQDTLGFDKPSKTLDWLLTKSKAAIDELALVKPTASCSITSTTVDHHEAQDSRQLKGNKALTSSKDKSLTRRQQPQPQQNNTGFGDFERESRAKARERARKRTKEKRSSKTLNVGSKQLSLPHCVPSIQPNYSTTWNQIMSSHNNSTPYFNVDHTTHQFPTNSLLNVSHSKLYSDSPRATENWDNISQSFALVNPSTADLQNGNKLGEMYKYQVMS